MPPKKDAKKGPAKELDPSIYIRKPVELDDIPVDPSVFERLAGKIANISTLFPVWNDAALSEEKWSEPLVSEQKVQYPKGLGITGEVGLLKYLNLEPVEVVVDPKAKKDAKKDAKKGAVEAPVELTEVLVDEHGRKLPVLFRDSDPLQAADSETPELTTPLQEDTKAYLGFDILRPFVRAYTEEQMAKIAQESALKESAPTSESKETSPRAKPVSESEAMEEPLGDEVDPFLCSSFRLVQRFASTIVRAHQKALEVEETEEANGAERSEPSTKHVLEGTFLWRSIYPKLPNGKPVYNPAGKYCVRLFLAGHWRRVYVDDSVPVTIDGRSALAFSAEKLELWPFLLAKAIYTVYSSCGYSTVVGDIFDYSYDGTSAAPETALEAAGFEGVHGESAKARQPYPLFPLCRAQCIAQFTAFAVHVMTGWQPRTPVSIKQIFTEELTRSAKLLKSIAVEGVAVVNEDDIVRDKNEVRASDRVARLRQMEDDANSAPELLQSVMSGENSTADIADVPPEEEIANSRPQSPLGPNASEDPDDANENYNEDEDLELGNIAEGSREHSTVMEEIGGIIEPPDDGIVRRTKQQFKSEYLRRKAHRDAVVARVLERERRIAHVSQQLDQLLTETFFVSYYEPETGLSRTLPVLAISYPSQFKTHLTEVQFLVNWKTGVPHDTEFSANPTPDDPETAEIKGIDEGPLPQTTPLLYEWLSVQQLIERNAFLMSMDTRFITPFETTFSNSWVPLSSLPSPGSRPDTASAADKPAVKEKPKGKDKAAVEVPVVEEYYADPGLLPVTLLRLNTFEFFSASGSSATGSGGPPKPDFDRQSSLTESGKHHPLKPEVRQVMRKGALVEAAATLREIQYEADLEEQSMLQTGSGAPVNKASPACDASSLKPMAEFLHFTVSIHADAVLEYKDAAPAISPIQQTDIKPDDGILQIPEPPAKAHQMLPSDTTLVLQEVRTDMVEPLMFVMELKEHSYMPMLSKSFAVSSKRLSSDPSQPLVFWLRLFSKASVHFYFSSEVSVSVGPAEDIWAGLGRSVFLREGVSDPTRSQTQQLVFRLPLVCEHVQSSGVDSVGAERVPESQEGSGGAEDPALESKGQDEAASSVPPSVPQYTVTRGMSFLHVAERGIDRLISLGLLPADRARPLAPLPRIQGNIVEFSSNADNAQVLLGRTFPAELFDKKAKSVPGFSWKLLILSDIPVKEPLKPINEEMVSQRFVGKFVANNKNALFRDIYTIDKLSFPLAFRLTTAHSRPPTGSVRDREQAEKNEKRAFAGMSSESARKALKTALTVKGKRKDLCLSVKLFRASDRKLVAEFKGRESVICYFQSLDPFLADGESFDVAAAVQAAADAKTAAAGGKGKAPPAKGGAKGAAPASSETVDVLVECTLDEEAMFIQDDWLSRFPHVFDCLFPDSAHATAQLMTEPAADKDKKKGDVAVDPQEAMRRNVEIVEAQQKCLDMLPPSKPLVKWQLDVMAGKIANISHDTSDLVKEMAIKNAWEDSSAGRGERSAAALRYFQERRAALRKNLQDSTPPEIVSGGEDEEKSSDRPADLSGASTSVSANVTRPSTSHGGQSSIANLTSTMTDSLVTALSADADQLTRRYTIMNNIPKQLPLIDVLQRSADESKLSFVKPRDHSDHEKEMELLKKVIEQRAQENEYAQNRHKAVAEKFVQLNSAMRQEAKDRVDAIVKEANADAIELAKLWEAREKYRLYVESQNASLNYLLKRATDAKTVARAAEKKAADEAAALAEKLRKEEEKKKAKKK